MSRYSKVNSTLRANILASLTVSGTNTNRGLYQSYIANPGQTYSLRAIQEATQKLKAEGAITSRKSFFSGNVLFSINKANNGTQTATASI